MTRYGVITQQRIKPAMVIRRYDQPEQSISREQAAAEIRMQRNFMRSGWFDTWVWREFGQIFVRSNDPATPYAIARRAQPSWAESTRREMEREYDRALTAQINRPDFDARAMLPGA